MSFKKIIKRFFVYTLVIVLAIIGVLFIIYTGPSLWNRWVTYPRLEKERSALWLKYKKPQQFISLREHKGILHSHTYWSHDSRGVLEEILPAAKKAKLDFLFFADHPHGKLDTFPRGCHGIYDGIIFESGTESSEGLMVCPMDSVVLDWRKDQDLLIKEVIDSGGLALYVHTEKPHDWANPDYQAMEIYNIHTDMLDEEKLTPLILNFVVNGKKYRHWAYRELYDEQTDILANWDSLNMHRKIVGMAAVDAHNNQNVRARYTDDGRVEWVGPNAETLKIVKPGWKEKLLLGEPDAAGWAYKFEVDTYFASFNYVNTHIFSDTLTNVAIKNNLVDGHAYISFENLAEAKGFQYFSTDENNAVNAIMGDSVLATSVSKLHAVSPFPVQFRLVKNGEEKDVADDTYSYEFAPHSSPGNYRIVASLFLDKKWTTWVQTNPIYVFEQTAE